MSITIESPFVLVVEGKDEERFFAALLKHMQISQVQVLGIGGKTNLTPQLKALVRTPAFSQVLGLGVVRDADSDPAAAFESVRYSLSAATLAVPIVPNQLSGNSPVVAVLIVPHDGTGALEDICLSSVASDPAIPCITALFDCVRPFLGPPRNVGKARVQAFLSCRPEEGKRLGEAAEAGYWPWEATCFSVLKEFIRLVTTV